MGKNHRHSKKLKSEKNKVHIKSKTKFLPKGQNVTTTSFKIKPIVLKEQLKETESTSSLNLKPADINELVGKLKHSNETVKIESCQKLREFVSSHPSEIVKSYLWTIIPSTSALVQDRESKVRQAAVKLLNTIFEKVSEDILQLFFKYVFLNLKCAMIHINKHIQQDSLLLLDAILEHKGVLLAEKFEEFIPNFLMLISKKKNQLTSEQSLSLNLEGKVTSVKWNIKVLVRLYGILHAVVEKIRSDNLRKSKPMCNVIRVENYACSPIYEDITAYETNGFLSFNRNSKKIHAGFDNHILNFIPLLHEIWMEVVPEKNSKNSSEPTVLTNDETVAVFSCIVNILMLLQEYLQDSEKEKLFLENKPILRFLDQLMLNFPYSHNRKKMKMAKELPKCFTRDQNCTEENLIIIYIFVTLRVENSRNNPKQNTIWPYLNQYLKTQYRPNSFSLLVKILKKILLEHPNFCRILGVDDSEIMENVSNLYPKLPEKFRSGILDVLASPKLKRHELWMRQLPDYLCEQRISYKLIYNVRELCIRGEKVVQGGVRNSLKRILDNLPHVTIFDVDPEPDVDINMKLAQGRFMSIFRCLKNLSLEDVEEIDKFILSNPDSPYSGILKDVLKERTYFKK